MKNLLILVLMVISKCNSPIGALSNRNVIKLLVNILYSVSSENTIKYSEMSIYEDPNKYNDKLRKNNYVLKGKISTPEDKLIS